MAVAKRFRQNTTVKPYTRAQPKPRPRLYSRCYTNRVEV